MIRWTHVTGFSLVLAAALAGSVLVLSYERVQANRQQLARNQDALSYICATTNILDRLDVAAGNQIRQNFTDGTYAKLRQQGILTDANIAAAHAALRQYQAAHIQLASNGACRSLATHR